MNIIDSESLEKMKNIKTKLTVGSTKLDKQSEGWIDRFNKEFFKNIGLTITSGTYSDTKQFIESELKRQKEEIETELRRNVLRQTDGTGYILEYVTLKDILSTLEKGK